MSSLRRLVIPLLAAALVTAMAGCDSGSDSSPPGIPQVKAMRFAGVDLEYALQRVAAESGLLLALDQIREQDNAPDLALYRIDLDLPAGTVDAALRKLKESAGGFDFEILDGVIYVRSSMLVTTKTPFDLPLLPASSFEGNADDLASYIRKTIPKSFVTIEHVLGEPVAPKVEFEIADKASVKDVLLQYARAAKLGWSMYRAGYLVSDPTHGAAVVGSSLQLRGSRTSTSRRPKVYNQMSTNGALASAAARLKLPMVVLDRSVFMNTRGFLNLSSQRDAGLPLSEALDDLGASGWGDQSYHFKWRMVDGVPVIESRDFLYRLAGRDLLRSELLAGEFDGSLPELARWLSTHQKKPTSDVLMGGEIAEGLPRAKLTIASGTTVLQVLVAFAKSSGVSPYVLLLGGMNPMSGKVLTHPNAWHGAYVQDLAEWLPTEEELNSVSGVLPPDWRPTVK